MIRLLIAAALALFTSMLGSIVLIRVLAHYGIGQPIRDDGPEGHRTKAGTPTMGGVALVVGAAVGYAVSDLFGGIYTRSGIIVMLTIIGGALVGFVDDYLKVSTERKLGLSKRDKMIGLLLLGTGFSLAMTELTSVHTTLSFHPV